MFGLLALMMAAAGCSGSDLVLPEDRAPRRATIEAGDDQRGPAGVMLAAPLVVRVRDAAARPVPEAEVAFTVLDDGGSVSPAVARTDERGLASARWILGPATGAQRVQAEVVSAGASDELVVVFTATAGRTGDVRLGVATQPSGSAVAGVVLEQQPVVQLEDESGGAAALEGLTVVAALGSGPGSLGGTTSRTTDADGRAEFTDLWIAGAEGSYTLLFSAQGLESAVSDEILVSTGSGAPTTVSIVEHTPDPSDVGRAVRFVVQVTPAQGGATPDGSFRVGTSNGESCTGVTSKGVCEIIFNSPGPRTITATYPGNESFAPGTSPPVSHTVNDVAGATRTIIGTSPDPSDVGEPVKIYVQVRGVGNVPANGSVVIYGDGSDRCGEGELLGTVELDGNGEAVLTTSRLSEGFHVIRGCYTGAPGFAPSEDGATQTVR